MINVIGLGYIGLPTALFLAAKGNTVVGTDRNLEILKKLDNKELPFEERGLKEIYEQALKNGLRINSSCIKADYYIIAVPTPYDKESKKVNSDFVTSAVKQVLDVCDAGATIIIESTVSPGTIHESIVPIIDNTEFILNKSIYIAHAPERIIPGNMLHELENNSRTIGSDDKDTLERVANLYRSFCKGTIIKADIKTAEMSKVVENSYRAVNIAFANELLKIAHKADIQVNELIEICNMHPRVNILQPGPGVGGHCIPIDPWFLVGDYPKDTHLIRTALTINKSMPIYVFNKVNEIIAKEKMESPKIGIYGLTYKPNTCDTRESPAIQFLNYINEDDNKFISYDPLLKEKIVENQVFDFDNFINSTDFIVIMMGHDHLKRNEPLISNKIILDTQNVFQRGYKL